jgi:hypothetical protein
VCRRYTRRTATAHGVCLPLWKTPSMSYEVRCECGKAHAVSAADAGSSLRCECRRAVEVPALHVLRASAGDDKLSPAFRLEGLLFSGRLPGTRSCARCNCETDERIQVSIVCERGTSGPDNSGSDENAQEALGCLLGSLFSWDVPNETREGYRPSRKQGQDVAFVVRLPVCSACNSTMNNLGALRVALRTIRVYADLLDHYPKALLARTG